MASQKRSPVPPARTPEDREQQLVAMAVDLAERQIREGTASSQVITHFLKLGTGREKLEREKLERENAVLRAKAEGLESQKRSEELFEQAMSAFRSYNGEQETWEEGDVEVF